MTEQMSNKVGVARTKVREHHFIRKLFPSLTTIFVSLFSKKKTCDDHFFEKGGWFGQKGILTKQSVQWA